MKGLFITGTDTGIGKTRVAQVLIYLLRQRYKAVAAMKPVASGAVFVNGLLQNEDAVLLQQAANVNVPYAVLNPYCFSPAIAPHLAAAQEGVVIDTKHIRSCYKKIAQQADVVVVEGAGGWQVPLNENQSIADLALELSLPVLLVVGLRLGCLNHALLSAQAIERSGAKMFGWVGNVVERDAHYVEENISTLKKNISTPCLGVLPFEKRFSPQDHTDTLQLN